MISDHSGGPLPIRRILNESSSFWLINEMPWRVTTLVGNRRISPGLQKQRCHRHAPATVKRNAPINILLVHIRAGSYEQANYFQVVAGDCGEQGRFSRAGLIHLRSMREQPLDGA